LYENELLTFDDVLIFVSIDSGISIISFSNSFREEVIVVVDDSVID
jgi:hypothetical protein